MKNPAYLSRVEVREVQRIASLLHPRSRAFLILSRNLDLIAIIMAIATWWSLR
jgi:hypothetical protein